MPHAIHPPVARAPRAARFLILLMLALLPPAAMAQSQFEGKTIREVVFKGLTGSTPAQMQALIKTRAGQPYHGLTIRDDLGRLSREVSTASVDANLLADGGVIVTFTVAESPVLGKIHVRGNQKLKTARIEQLIDKKAGDRVDDNLVVRVRQSILNEYQKMGMPQADVKMDLIDVPTTSPAQRVDLQVLIAEGTQTRVEDVIIHGNQAFASIRLRTLLLTKGSVAFIKNYYNDALFEQDLVNLRDFYTAHGYWDARVERGVFEQKPAGKDAALISPVIEITEGERYRFGKITVRGVHVWSQNEADAPFAGLTGRNFSAIEFMRAMGKLESLYYDHGLLTTKFNKAFDRKPQTHTLDITIEVAEGQRIYVGKVNVVRPEFPPEKEKPGKFRQWYESHTPPVKDEVIAREILLKPGDLYNKRLERDSLRRLARLQAFDPAPDKLKAYNKPTTDPDIHDMVIELQEKPTGVLGGGVGYGDVTGPFVFGRFTENNVGGRADVFNTELLLGTRDSHASISYFDRHFGDSPDSLLSEVFYQTLRRPGYRANTGGLIEEWGHDLGEDRKLYIRGRLEYVALSPAHGVDAHEDLSRSYPVVTGRVRWVEDTRGPIGGLITEGQMKSYSTELGYAGAPLARLEAERDRYTKVTDMVTWRLAASAGFMPYDRDTVPIHERYFLGGSQDMRGFAYRGAGYFDKDEEDVPIGGAAKVLIKNELIRPIIDPIAGVLFVDVGDLGRSPISWQVPRVSTGAGLRFNFQRVQVAIDLAAPITTLSDDRTQFFHFSMKGAL
ncbi:MAG: POTRA domain-containing protein [Candidatus Sumerlaeia bacterium]